MAVVKVTPDYIDTINGQGITFTVDSTRRIHEGFIDVEFGTHPLLPDEIVAVVSLPLQHPESEADTLPLMIALEACDGTHRACQHVRHFHGEGCVQLPVRKNTTYTLVAIH